MDSLHYRPIQMLGENMIHPTNPLKLGNAKKSVTTAKVLKSSKDFAQKRSFGDISNRVGRTLAPKGDPTTLPVKVVKEKPKPKVAKPSTKFRSPFPEPDFRPDIVETEDDDLLPDHCKLSDETIMKLVKFWNCSSNPKGLNCPPSPTHSLELLPTFEGNDSLEPLALLPIEDDFGVYDLPPPLWEN